MMEMTKHFYSNYDDDYNRTINCKDLKTREEVEEEKETESGKEGKEN
jgi:hypothetical protein